MKKKPPPEPAGDVPMWFMTYSDVITLMMTFFILLLTFATSEPERFEQMKVSLFGASGANGLVGDRPDGTEKDSWAMRTRPRSSRLTDRGAEVPPVDSDASEQSLDKGLAGLEDEERRQVVDSLAFTLPGSSMSSADGKLYAYGLHHLELMANTMQNRAYELTIEISSSSQQKRAVSCILFMYHVKNIRPDRLMICRDEFEDLPGNMMRFRLRFYQSRTNGKTGKEAAE